METKNLKVNINCQCTYDAYIKVPENLTLEEAIQYAKDHIDEIPVGSLVYTFGSDKLNEDECGFFEPPFKPGDKVVYHSCEAGKHLDYEADVATVLYALTKENCLYVLPETGPMYAIKFPCEDVFYAYESELELYVEEE